MGGCSSGDEHNTVTSLPLALGSTTGVPAVAFAFASSVGGTPHDNGGSLAGAQVLDQVVAVFPGSYRLATERERDIGVVVVEVLAKVVGSEGMVVGLNHERVGRGGVGGGYRSRGRRGDRGGGGCWERSWK